MLPDLLNTLRPRRTQGALAEQGTSAGGLVRELLVKAMGEMGNK